MANNVPPIKELALLVGGGPAPGINGVISAVTIEAINKGIEVIGIQDGFKWLVKGDTDALPPARPSTTSRTSTCAAAPSSAPSRTNPTKSEAGHAERARGVSASSASTPW